MVATRWVQETIEEFGQSLGLTGLQINDNGVAAVEVAALGALYIEPQDDAVLVYGAQEFAHLSVDELERALAVGHPGTQRSEAVRAGIRGESQLVFCVRIPVHEFTLARVESCIDAIYNAFDTVRAG